MDKIVIVDCGIGNVQSVFNAVSNVNRNAEIIRKPDDLFDAKVSRIVMPGVGAVGRYVEKLTHTGFASAIKERAGVDQIPLLGICVGMQALASKCLEFGEHRGLNLIEGVVRPLKPIENLKIPHVGWNQIDVKKHYSFLMELNKQDFYFVHSFYYDCPLDFVIATTNYGSDFASIIGRQNIYGVQFHPEKSAIAGESLLRNFIEYGGL